MFDYAFIGPAQPSPAATLFEPVQAGEPHLAGRVVLVPLTRSRSPNAVAGPFAARCYSQRASGGLLITEATAITQQGQGHSAVPGLYGAGQSGAWRQVTDAVHQAHGKIVGQLWHVGRVCHTDLQPDNGAPVAPSAIAAKTKTVLIKNGKPEFVDTCLPRALRAQELPGMAHRYRVAARSAVQTAGFDGVEIRGVNGYLLDQFLRSSANHRQDDYGGSIENRARLLPEVTRAVTSAIGGGKTGIRLWHATSSARVRPSRYAQCAQAMSPRRTSTQFNGVGADIGSIDVQRCQRAFFVP